MTVRFAAKINILTSQSAFFNCSDKAPGPEAKYPWSDKTRVFTDTNASTVGIQTCNAGGFATTEKAMLFHFQSRQSWWDESGTMHPKTHIDMLDKRWYHTPQDIYPQDYAEALNHDYKDLKAKDPAIRGFLSGGWESFPPSHYLRNLLTTVYAKLKLPFSMLWGGQGVKFLHYSLPKDTWTLYVEDAAKTLTMQPVTRLTKLFSKIAIDPGDTVSIDNTPILPETLAQSGLLKSSQQGSQSA